MMRNTTAARVAAALALSLLGSADAFAQDRVPGATVAIHPAGPAPGPSQWSALLAQGRPLPNRERLVVVDRDGGVLRVVDGEEFRVLLPYDLHVALSAGHLDATLVHNHLVPRGFSCADLRQLANRGVTSVVAVGSDGSVFEATAGSRFDAALLEEDTCGRWLTRVAGRLSRELGQEFGDHSDLADQVPHLFATALFRLGAIGYQATPAVRTRITQFRHAVAMERVVSTIANELSAATRRSAALKPPSADGQHVPTLASP